jgi:hypothetical protein
MTKALNILLAATLLSTMSCNVFASLTQGSTASSINGEIESPLTVTVNDINLGTLISGSANSTFIVNGDSTVTRISGDYIYASDAVSGQVTVTSSSGTSNLSLTSLQIQNVTLPKDHAGSGSISIVYMVCDTTAANLTSSSTSFCADSSGTDKGSIGSYDMSDYAIGTDTVYVGVNYLVSSTAAPGTYQAGAWTAVVTYTVS